MGAIPMSLPNLMKPVHSILESIFMLSGFSFLLSINSSTLHVNSSFATILI